MQTDVQSRIAARNHWYHCIEVSPGVFTPGINDPLPTLAALRLPDDLRGQRILDLGTRDGFFAFECERRGANVVAVDYLPARWTGYPIVADLVGSLVPYTHANVYELTPATVGTFDTVLMLGLLYHLPDPLGALAVVRSLCRGRLYVTTHVCDDTLPEGVAAQPLMRFHPAAAFNDDPTNFWTPNLACLREMLAEAGFAVERAEFVGGKGHALVCARSGESTERARHLAIARGTRAPDGEYLAR